MREQQGSNEAHFSKNTPENAMPPVRSKTKRKELTPATVRRLEKPTNGRPVYIFDTNPKHLCVRVTPAGAKTYVYAGKLGKTPFRISIGATDIWNLDEARREARRLQVMVDNGDDPRQVKADQQEAKDAAKLAKEVQANAQVTKKARESVTLGEAWARYLANPPKKNGKTWGERHMLDHKKMMLPERIKGEDDKKRTLTAGVLASLVPLSLAELTSERIGAWLEEEAARRPTQAALGFRLLRAFLNWCNGRDEYRNIAASDACDSKVSKEHLPKAGAKNDSLQREQLCSWFGEVKKLNPVQSAYLQTVLLTGPRRNEMTRLTWDDVDFKWNSMSIRDKVEGVRTIPLTPYIASLLLGLKAINETDLVLRGVLGKVELLSHELINLEVGDIIKLYKPANALVDLYVEETPWFKGEMGSLKKNRAIAIKETMKRGSDPANV